LSLGIVVSAGILRGTLSKTRGELDWNNFTALVISTGTDESLPSVSRLYITESQHVHEEHEGVWSRIPVDRPVSH
jgi:hypothetical protein